VVFIKKKMVLPLKFCSKLNETSRQYQSHCAICSIINFKKKIKRIKKIYFFKKNKNFVVALGHLRGGWPPPLAMGVGSHPHGRIGVVEPPSRRSDDDHPLNPKNPIATALVSS
jgi:hypothetical protein